MMDFLFIIGIFLAAVVCVVGLRLTKPAPVRVPVVQEPLRITHQPEPLPEPVHVFETPTVAYADEIVKLPATVLSFLEGL